MPKVSFQDVLPYKAAELYELIMDVESYPSIFDDILSVRICREENGVKNVDVRAAALVMELNYNCDVTGTPPARIDITAISGDFESMKACWEFAVMPDGKTRVSYEMDFDFGGLGFKNAAAMAFMDEAVQRTKNEFKAHAASVLQPVTPATGPQMPKPPGM